MRIATLLVAMIALLVPSLMAAPASVEVEFAYFQSNPASDEEGLPPGTRPAYLSSANRDTRGVAFNRNSSEAFETVLISEDDGNQIIVCNADTGSEVRTISGVQTGDGTVDPYDIAVSDDGVIFVNGFGRTVRYLSDDTASPASGTVIAGSAVNGGVGASRALHATGSVTAGTCRLYISAGGNTSVVDVSGTLPGPLTGTEITTFTSTDADGTPAGAAFTETHAITGSVNRIYTGQVAAGRLDANDVQAGADLIVPSADDTYVQSATGQAICDNQPGQAFVVSGLSVIEDPTIYVDTSFVNPGVWALFEAGGPQDGVMIASLGDGSAPNTEFLPGGDGDGDGIWDAGAVNINGASQDGEIDAAFNVAGDNKVNVYAVGAGTDGFFARLSAPLSIPVELSVFSQD